MSLKKKTVLIVCCILVAGGAVAVYSRMNTKNVAVAAQPSQVTVAAARPVLGDIALTGEFIGTVEPGEKVLVFPKIAGTVLRTYFEVGDRVKKGDLLYELETDDLQLAYDVAVAQVDAQKAGIDQELGSGYDTRLLQAKANLDMAQKGYNSARSALKDYNDSYDDALVTLDKEISKLEALIKSMKDQTPVDREALSKAEVQLSMMQANFRDLENDTDPALRGLRTAYQNAQIGYDSAKAAYDLASVATREETQISADAKLKAAEAGLTAQGKNLEYAKIYAPIDGVIEQKNVDAHSISSNTQIAYTISNKEVMTAVFSVSESIIATLAVGEPVEIEHNGERFTGAIIELPTMVDPQTGLFNVKASVGESGAALRTGSTVKLFAATDRAENALLVPLDCVYYDELTPYVYIDRDGVAVRTEVTTGLSDQKLVQLVSGVSAGDEVITTWHPRLLDGAHIVRSDAATPAAPTN